MFVSSEILPCMECHLGKPWNASKCSQLKTNENYLILLKQGMPQGQHDAITDLGTHTYPFVFTIILLQNHSLYLTFLK